jgi:hypothetical protein
LCVHRYIVAIFVYALILVAVIAATIYATKAFLGSVEGTKERDMDSPRPDVPATRQWVEDVVNAKTSNCMHVTGSTQKRNEDRLSRLERLNRQGGYLAFIDDKSVRELGFDYLCGSIHVGGGAGEYYRLIDVTMKDGDMGPNGSIIGGTIVGKDDKRYNDNVNANYDLVCTQYKGMGTEMSTEVGISKELADRLIAEYKAKEV